MSPTSSINEEKDGEEYSPSIIRHESHPDDRDEQLSEPVQEYEPESGETQDLKEIQEPLELWLFNGKKYDFVLNFR
jgi:hypothetical protein